MRVAARGRGVGCRAPQCRAESDEPDEDQPEADDLESREGDQSEDEHDDRRHEDDGDGRAHESQPARGVGAREHHDEDPEEREHRARGAALVQRGVDVERNEADEGEVGAERGDQHDEHPREMDVRVHGCLEPLSNDRQLVTHAGREHQEQAARRHRAEVERRAGEIAVRAELAEVQGPPHVVGGRRGGHRGAEHEQHDGAHRQLARVEARPAQNVEGLDRNEGSPRAASDRLDGRSHRLTAHRSGRSAHRQAPWLGGRTERHGQLTLPWMTASRPVYRNAPTAVQRIRCRFAHPVGGTAEVDHSRLARPATPRNRMNTAIHAKINAKTMISNAVRVK